MSFSPMYQPVTTTTIKADGDMDISPYDLQCRDVLADTVEATEFVGGVGNFTSLVMPTLSYEGFTTFTPLNDSSAVATEMEGITIFASPFPVSGKVSIAKTGGSSGKVFLIVNTTSGLTKREVGGSQTEYAVDNVLSICINVMHGYASAYKTTATYGIPKLINE